MTASCMLVPGACMGFSAFPQDLNPAQNQGLFCTLPASPPGFVATQERNRSFAGSYGRLQTAPDCLFFSHLLLQPHDTQRPA